MGYINAIAYNILARKANEHFGYTNEKSDLGQSDAPILDDDIRELIEEGDCFWLRDFEKEWIMSQKDILRG